MYKPKISVILAVYNRVDKVEQCILSVVNQIYDNIEFIVIDGGSTDGTVEIIKKYSKKISYWISERDSGIYDAWNKGIRQVSGEYVNFIGSDDAFCNSRVIEKVVLELDKDVDILSGCLYGVQEKFGIEQCITNDHVRDKNKYGSGCIPTQGMFIKSEILKDFLFDTKYKISADYKFFLMCYYDENIKFKYIYEPIQFFSTAGISTTHYEFVRKEDNEIYKELGLEHFIDIHKRMSFLGSIKLFIKKIASFLGLYDQLFYLFHLYVKKDFQKHKCENRICRWCNRYRV